MAPPPPVPAHPLSLCLPVCLQLLGAGELLPGVSAEEFAARRAALGALLPPGGIALLPSAAITYMAGGSGSWEPPGPHGPRPSAPLGPHCWHTAKAHGAGSAAEPPPHPHHSHRRDPLPLPPRRRPALHDWPPAARLAGGGPAHGPAHAVCPRQGHLAGNLGRAEAQPRGRGRGVQS